MNLELQEWMRFASIKRTDADTLEDIAILTELGIKNPEVKDLLDQVVRDWRTHALLPCNDFAYN